MLRSIQRALDVRRDLGITGVATEAEVDRALAAFGLAVRDDRPYLGRIRGRLFRGTVCLRRGMHPSERRMIKAHELGHHVCGHAADEFYLQALAGAPPRSFAEIEADLFGFALHVGRPSPTLDGLTRQMRAAFDADLPLDWLCAVVSLLTQRLPAVRGYPLLELA